MQLLNPNQPFSGKLCFLFFLEVITVFQAGGNFVLSFTFTLHFRGFYEFTFKNFFSDNQFTLIPPTDFIL